MDIMKDLGVEYIRIFLIGEDFALKDDNLRENTVAKLKELLDIAWSRGIGVFITLIVGHMSGKNYKLPWEEVSVYSENDLKRTLRFIERIVKLLKDHPAVSGWILSNELSLYEKPVSVEEALRLLEETSKLVKSLDPIHVYSSGDIPSSILQDPLLTCRFVDYIGPHLYIYDTDEVRNGFTYATLIELSRNAGNMPVLLEEFGSSTCQFSEESQAGLIREVLYTALAHSASGALVWCYSDFDLEDVPPYSWRPLELGFGLVKSNGEYKLSGKVFKEFSREKSLLEGVIREAIREWNALIIANYCLRRTYPFTWCNGMNRDSVYWNLSKILSTSYMLISHVSPGPLLIHEETIREKQLPENTSLIVYPSVVEALSPTWRRLLEYVENGIVLYASFMRGIGESIYPHTSPTHMWEELFGVEPGLESGFLGKVVYGDYKLTLTRDVGLLKRGMEIKLHFFTSIWLYKARPLDADVLAVDNSGDPVLFQTKRGGGHSLLSLVPFEIMLVNQLRLDYSSAVFKLFKELFSSLGVTASITVEDPRIDTVVYRSPKYLVIFLINHSWTAIGTKLTVKTPSINILKIAGRGIIAGSNRREIHIEIPGKSALVLKVILVES